MSRLEKHNEAYAAKFGIEPDRVRDIAQNPDWFVQPLEGRSEEVLAPGVVLTKQRYDLPDGNFTNVYDVCVRPDSPATIKLLSFPTPKKPTHIFRDEPDAVAIQNATFFKITDDTDPIIKKGPPDGTLNWCMRDGKIVGLPAASRPAVFEVDGKLIGREIEARGSVLINGVPFDWVGGQSIMHAPKDEWGALYDPRKATVFNAACMAVVKEQDNPHGLRMVEKETYHTPKNADVTALGVMLEKDGVLRVASVKPGGGMGIFDGNFILQVPNSVIASAQIEVGAVVSPRTLDGIELSKVGSALTTGPSVLDYLNDIGPKPIDNDRSFGQPPPFTDKRYARSIIFKDPHGIHLRGYDAVPMSTNFKGMTPHEVAKSLPKDTEWAYFWDGGQSELVAVREKNGQPEFFGNAHYATGKLSFMEARATGKSAPEKSMLVGRRRPLPSVAAVFFEEQK